MSDVECPYCEHPQDINHDDGYGYGEDDLYEQTCPECDKTFTFTTGIIFVYHAERADCLNGGEHELTPVVHSPVTWPDWVRCRRCNYEDRGKEIATRRKP